MIERTIGSQRKSRSAICVALYDVKFAKCSCRVSNTNLHGQRLDGLMVAFQVLRPENIGSNPEASSIYFNLKEFVALLLFLCDPIVRSIM
jgi:hypothetical protein